jgi:hypothetical protein
MLIESGEFGDLKKCFTVDLTQPWRRSLPTSSNMY